MRPFVVAAILAWLLIVVVTLCERAFGQDAPDVRGTCKELGYFVVEVAGLRFDVPSNVVKDGLASWLSREDREQLRYLVDRVYDNKGDQIDLALKVIEECEAGDLRPLDYGYRSKT